MLNRLSILNGLLIFSLVLSLMLMVACGNAVKESLPADSRERRYFDGANWHTVFIQLNQLYVERRGNASATDLGNANVIMLRQGASSVAALEDVARQMQQAQSDIIAINGYVRSADDQQAPAQRLTNKFALRLLSGINPEPLLAKYQARLLEKVTYSADTYLCEATSATLFGVLNIVVALQQETGVVFVMPQIEHLRSKR